MTGWIKLHRSMQDHWMFDFDNPDKALAWIDLLLSAKHEGGMVNYGSRPLYLKRGDVGVSQVTLQKRWKWSQNKVKRFLLTLKKHDMIDFETNDLTTVISICNYDSYQHVVDDRERPNERPVERGSNDQSNDKQECKNVKNVRSNVNGKKFIKPAIDDIKVYMTEKGSTGQHEKFFDYYESNGWKVGKNPMKCWKAAIRNWLKNNYSNGQEKLEGDYVE